MWCACTRCGNGVFSTGRGRGSACLFRGCAKEYLLRRQLSAKAQRTGRFAHHGRSLIQDVVEGHLEFVPASLQRVQNLSLGYANLFHWVMRLSSGEDESRTRHTFSRYLGG